MSLHVNKCSGSSNNMSRTNETRHMSWNKTYACKCRLVASVCNDKQRWNNNKCRCECKELIHIIKVNVMMDLFGIPVYVNANVINHKMLENI